MWLMRQPATAVSVRLNFTPRSCYPHVCLIGLKMQCSQSLCFLSDSLDRRSSPHYQSTNRRVSCDRLKGTIASQSQPSNRRPPSSLFCCNFRYVLLCKSFRRDDIQMPVCIFPVLPIVRMHHNETSPAPNLRACPTGKPIHHEIRGRSLIILP